MDDGTIDEISHIHITNEGILDIGCVRSANGEQKKVLIEKHNTRCNMHVCHCPYRVLISGEIGR